MDEALCHKNGKTPRVDLVGGPFAVIESDPGVFTSLTRDLGVRGLEFVEVYGIEPSAMDHLRPYGLVLCFLWRKDSHPPTDFDDPAAEKVWFANQLSTNSCATHAILHVLLNGPGINMGRELETFKLETQEMSPVMKGLAATNFPFLRERHNAMARPADVRAAMSSLAISTLDSDAQKKKDLAASADGRPHKRQKVGQRVTKTGKGKAKSQEEEDEEPEEGYHFVGYVPAHGKVWELDGFKSGPLEVGELPVSSTDSPPKDVRQAWIDVVRPALRMKMERYGGSGDDGGDIRFNLLALVEDCRLQASDEFEFLRRDKIGIEQRLQDNWQQNVDEFLLAKNFTGQDPQITAAPFSPNFAHRRMQRDLKISQMDQSELIAAWEICVKDLALASVALDDEIAKAHTANADRIKRTFDYEPFFKMFITRLHEEGQLHCMLDLDEKGRKRRKKAGNGAGTGKKG